MSSSPTASSRNAETLKRFQRDVSRLLTDRDRDYLHDVLKDFHAGRSVEHLVTSLKSCLDTPKKMDLLVDIRNLLPPSYRSRFDNLAPYNLMSKPFRPPSQTTIHKTQSTNSLKAKTNGNFRVVNLQKPSPDSALGFSIRGGREFGTGVYISNVDENTMALKEGLQVGDQVIECNGIDFENITHSSAVNLLSDISKVKLVVKSEGRVPEFNEIKAGFSWVDSQGLPVEDVFNGSDNSDKASSGHHSLEFQANINLLNSVDEKRINFTIDSINNNFIGFNLRGGKEYGLGIYVSKVDRESVAEQAGLQVGDLILDVNGTSFESILHQEAVDFVKAQKHIIMTVKSVGILPAAKLFYSDVSWIYPDGTRANVSHETMQDMLMLPVPDSQEVLRRDSSVQVDLMERSPSPAPPRSEVGIQADTPERDIQIQVSESVFSSPPAEEQPTRTERETDPVQVPESSPYDVIQSVSPYVTSLNTKTAKLKSGDDESTGSVNERSSNGSGVSSEDFLSRPSDNEDGPNGRKRKVKKSKSFLQKQGDKIKAKLSFRKKGDQKNKVRKKGDKEMMSHVDNRCKNLLDVNDYNTVMAEIRMYKDQEEDVEGLVNNLLLTLDTPRKAILLRDIRAIILPYDVGRFDAMISNREVEALEFYGNKTPASPVLEDNAIPAKPKKTIVEAVQDSHGNFQLRTRSEAEQIKKTREELKKERLALKVQGSSILEREAKKTEQDRPSWSNENTNNSIEMGPMIQVIDTSSDSPHLSTFGVPSPPPPALPPDLPAVEVHDTSFINQASNSEFGNFLAVPDRVSVEYKEEMKNPELTFDLPKIRTSMGISISGGSASRAQPEIRIEKVFPGGAADDDGTLQPGWELISIDGESLQGVSHSEAVDIVRRAYNDKSKSVMHIVCIPT